MNFPAFVITGLTLLNESQEIEFRIFSQYDVDALCFIMVIWTKVRAPDKSLENFSLRKKNKTKIDYLH